MESPPPLVWKRKYLELEGAQFNEDGRVSQPSIMSLDQLRAYVSSGVSS